jgi:hypothetical protein
VRDIPPVSTMRDIAIHRRNLVLSNQCFERSKCAFGQVSAGVTWRTSPLVRN